MRKAHPPSSLNYKKWNKTSETKSHEVNFENHIFQYHVACTCWYCYLCGEKSREKNQVRRVCKYFVLARSMSHFWKIITCTKKYNKAWQRNEKLEIRDLNWRWNQHNGWNFLDFCVSLFLFSFDVWVMGVRTQKKEGRVAGPNYL